MNIKIGHASIDENGNAADGRIGDQTKKEVCIRMWYDKPWNVYLECLDPEMAKKAAMNMIAFTMNDNIGYDQKQRLSMYYSIVANKGNISKAKGETDCSAAVSTAYILAGLDISPACTTRDLRKVLIKTGKFKAYTDASHISSGDHAKIGSIYLSEGHHVVMVIENGCGENPYLEPTTTIYYDIINKKVICKDDAVKWVQYELIKDGITEIKANGKINKLTIDGECGSITDAAIRVYQFKHGLTVDGKVGPATRNSLKSN